MNFDGEMIRKKILTMSILVCVLFGQLITVTYGQTVNVSTSNKSRKPRFISFDSNAGKIDVALDLSVPFLSIPLEDKNEGPPMPLISINAKALTIFGALMAISAFVLPLIVKKIPEPIAQSNGLHHLHHHHQYSKEHKRSDRGYDHWDFEDSINEILFRDSRVTPCLQRVVCSAVKRASRAKYSTSVDKIIDGLFSLKWFEQAANGTVIKEAVEKGRNVSRLEECTEIYENCALNQQIITNFLKMIGI